jgi:DNA topoisomerase-6 subunit B
VSENSITKKMSAAAFFNENRAIAGFGNSMRAVFTSIRELVENGLDSAEKRGTNPVVSIDLRKLSSREINELLDVTQYKKLEKHLDFLQLSCRDNGVGVPGNEIADLFGRVLTGTKYGVIQTRGRFGLGAKMCLLYSMSSVDLPAKIRSRYFMDDITHEMHLMINLEKNEPIIMEQHEYLPGDPNYLEEPGLEISITFTGAWRLAKNSVKEYFRQLAIITPYSSFKVRLPGEKEGESEELDYDSVVDDMPPPPVPVKIHPWGCDITQFKAELAVTRSKKLKEFLATQFMGVNEEIAEHFFQLLEIDPNKSPKDITSHEIRRIVHEGFVKAYQEAKDVKRKRDRIFQFDAPRGTALSPLGANRLRKGLEKELEPKFVEAVTRAPKAYSGHPFVIEAALGYGGGVAEASQVKGSTVTDNKIIYRYANRIPLVFGAGNDVITHVVSSIRWNDYGLTRQSDPLAIAVSLVSTKIPFPETSKEYISIVPEIEEEIRLALMQLGRRLKTFLSRAKRKRREHARLSRFVRSAPIIVENLTKILEDEDLSYTDFRLETDRIAAALAHGATKKVKLFMPLGKRLFGANVWCPSRIQSALKSKDIETVADFLITPSEELVTLLSLSEKDIYNIKLRTISELDREGMSPRFDPKIFVSRTIEKRFVSDNGKSFDSLKDSLYRRWIQNSYHYFATDYRKLQTVAGLPEKLFENMREDLLHQFLLNMTKKNRTAISSEGKQLIASLTKTSDLKIQTLFPSFNYLKDNSKGLITQETTIEEFLFQTKLPTSINYQVEITAILVNYMKNVYSQLCDKFPEFAKTNITKMTPDWTDAYTKNAFHRRKIKTIEDFLNVNLDELIVIKELERKLYASFMEILSQMKV